MFLSEKDFYLQRREADGRWQLACSLALAFHLAVLALAFWSPSLFSRPPKPMEIVSVTMVGKLPEPAGPSGAASPPPAGQQSTPPRQEKPEEPPPPPEPSAPPEPSVPPPSLNQPVSVPVSSPPQVSDNPHAISIEPDKRKKRVAQDTRLDEEKQREEKKDMERQRLQEEQDITKRLAELRRQAERKEREEKQRREQEKKREEQRRETERRRNLAEQAERERHQAEAEASRLRAEADRLAAEAAAAREAANSVRAQGTGGGSSSAGAAGGSPAGQNYMSGVVQRLQSFWKKLPDRSWNPSLEARVVVTVGNDGSVLGVQFDKSSGDPAFDQLVRETISKAAPMPAFPVALQQQAIEVPCRFNIGDLGKQ